MDAAAAVFFLFRTDSQNNPSAILAAGASSGHHQVHPRCTGGGDGRSCQAWQGEKRVEFFSPPITRLKRHEKYTLVPPVKT